MEEGFGGLGGGAAGGASRGLEELGGGTSSARDSWLARRECSRRWAIAGAVQSVSYFAV